MSIQSKILPYLIGPVMSYIARTPSIQEQRARFAKVARFTRLPNDVTISRSQVKGVPVEWITTPRVNPEQVILYCHGGGCTMGLYTTQRDFIARLGRAAGTRTLAVRYRLAPEHPFPAALTDITSVYQGLLESRFDPGRIVFVGESSGGGLALAALIHLRDTGEPLPACAVCFSPQTDLAFTGDSVQTMAQADVVNRPFDVTGNASQYAGDHPLEHPLISPLYADLRDLPPIILHVGTREIMLDDATRFAISAQQAGVDIELTVWSEMLHAFPLQAAFLPEAQEAIHAAAVSIFRLINQVHPMLPIMS